MSVAQEIHPWNGNQNLKQYFLEFLRHQAFEEIFKIVRYPFRDQNGAILFQEITFHFEDVFWSYFVDDFYFLGELFILAIPFLRAK